MATSIKRLPGTTSLSQPTEVFLGYDSKALYVAFHCHDDPAKVRANIAKRDDIFNDDYVGMLLDTFNDHRKAYELDFNTLGVQEDGIWQDPIFNEDFNPDFGRVSALFVFCRKRQLCT